MVQTPLKAITLEEFLQAPETKPASEYIDGQIIQKPMPQGKHSAIQGELVTMGFPHLGTLRGEFPFGEVVRLDKAL